MDRDCVACGVCVKNCPLAALLVHKGLHAAVDAEKCVGCGKCARVCPAGAIEIELRRCATV
ncbi:MAG: 4Fe-4S binding protein [Clostridiales bacterium]|nr:4Fe-4S binding protein [Clostridiales bacterium]